MALMRNYLMAEIDSKWREKILSKKARIEK